jgi:ankyrin repeat protein
MNLKEKDVHWASFSVILMDPFRDGALYMNRSILLILIFCLVSACAPKQPADKEAKWQLVSMEMRNQQPDACAELWTSLRAGEVEEVERLLQQQVHPHCLNDQGEYPLFFLINNWQPLLIQASKKKEETRQGLMAMTKAFFKAGADPNFENGDKAAALYMAVFFELTPVIKLCLEHGGDPQQMAHTGLTPFELARMMGHKEAEALLVPYLPSE